MKFFKPVSVVENPKINEWLTLVEKEMRNTLARLLAQSVQDCANFLNKDRIDDDKFTTWLDSYQVNNVYSLPKSPHNTEFQHL